jgi:hypothetical protein
MKRTVYYKQLFLIVALWQIIAGMSSWLGSIFMPDTFFGMMGVKPTTTLFPYHVTFWLIIVFGIGYLIVWRDLSKNHGLVLVGIIGKVIYFIICVITIITHEASLALGITATIDLAFAVLFTEFLLSTKQVPIKL